MLAWHQAILWLVHCLSRLWFKATFNEPPSLQSRFVAELQARYDRNVQERYWKILFKNRSPFQAKQKHSWICLANFGSTQAAITCRDIHCDCFLSSATGGKAGEMRHRVFKAIIFWCLLLLKQSENLDAFGENKKQRLEESSMSCLLPPCISPIPNHRITNTKE